MMIIIHPPSSKIRLAGKTTITNWCRPKLDVVCLVDLHRSQHQAGREKVLEDVRFACQHIPGAVVHHIQFEKLDYGESNALDKFYNSDVAIIEMSVKAQQTTLFYQLGLRENFGMKQNILLYYDTDKEATQQTKLTCMNNSFVSYLLSPDNCLVTTDPTINQTSLVSKLRHLLEMNEVQSKVELCWHQFFSF